MRIFRFLSAAALLCLPLQAAAEEGGFGELFNNDSPAALEAAPQTIEPAAGEAILEEQEPAVQSGTGVTSTAADRGEDEAGIRVFYQTGQDGSIMDHNDAGGVEFKLPEFE